MAEAFRDIQGPVEIPNPWARVLWLMGLTLLAGAAWLVWRRRRRNAEPKTAVEPPMPPHERARERLQAAWALIGQPRPFCIALSDTVRNYLEERFRFRAPDRTTEESLEELRESTHLTIDQKRSLSEFLMRCDLVKFARAMPGEFELKILFDAAVRLIDETEPMRAAHETATSDRPESKPVRVRD